MLHGSCGAQIYAYSLYICHLVGVPFEPSGPSSPLKPPFNPPKEAKARHPGRAAAMVVSSLAASGEGPDEGGERAISTS